MTKLSDLPRELTEEILSRLPVTSMKAVRSTCKNWNTLTKDRILIKKEKNEYQVVMILKFKVYLVSINLHSTRIERIGKLKDAHRVQFSQIFHCNGLLLCSTNDLSSYDLGLVVWNPYLGQTKWIKCRNVYHELDSYVLGYDNSCGTHKILRSEYKYKMTDRYEIFSFDSNSWKLFDGVTPDQSTVIYYNHGVSLDGNTYWFAKDKSSSLERRFLISFDFTTEKFGPKLSLPFHPLSADNVILSAFKEKQLAVLFQKYQDPHRSVVQIWITSKIEPDVVSWNKLFLELDVKSRIHYFLGDDGSFFVDEEKKVVVVSDRGIRKEKERNIVYIIGNNGYFKVKPLCSSQYSNSYPFMCHYVPSLVEII